MGSMMYEMNQWLLGDFGRGILNTLQENKTVFLILFAFYGGVLLYARIIYMYYIPKKIKQFVHDNESKAVSELHQLWEEKRKSFPVYILVPVGKEMWVQPLKNSSGSYTVLYFNKKNSYESEQDLIIKYSEL
ncbi:hypothetical protein [Enterococcus olivae]